MTFEEWWDETGQETLYALNTLTDADAKVLAKIAWESAPVQPVKQEPVAWIHPMDFGRECGVTPNQESDEQIPLYAAPVDAKAIRAEVLEEAAKVCDEQPRHSGDATTFYVATGQCAAAIRGLK